MSTPVTRNAKRLSVVRGVLDTPLTTSSKKKPKPIATAPILFPGLDEPTTIEADPAIDEPNLGAVPSDADGLISTTGVTPDNLNMPNLRNLAGEPQINQLGPGTIGVPILGTVPDSDPSDDWIRRRNSIEIRNIGTIGSAPPIDASNLHSIPTMPVSNMSTAPAIDTSNIGSVPALNALELSNATSLVTTTGTFATYGVNDPDFLLATSAYQTFSHAQSNPNPLCLRCKRPPNLCGGVASCVLESNAFTAKRCDLLQHPKSYPFCPLPHYRPISRGRSLQCRACGRVTRVDLDLVTKMLSGYHKGNYLHLVRLAPIPTPPSSTLPLQASALPLGNLPKLNPTPACAEVCAHVARG